MWHDALKDIPPEDTPLFVRRIGTWAFYEAYYHEQNFIFFDPDHELKVSPAFITKWRLQT